MTSVLVIVGVIILVIIVICILAMLRKKIVKSGTSASSSPSPSESSSSSSSSHRGHSKYKVRQGKILTPEEQEQYRLKVESAQKAVQGENPLPSGQEFPRNLAKASNPVSNSQLSKFEKVYVESMAELFSPKNDLETEFGVTQDEFDKLVSNYKKTREFKERKLPVNKHFNMKDYNNVKNVMRESATNIGINHASKRGTITESIYKAHGKNFLKQKISNVGDNISLVSNPIMSKDERERSKLRNNGHLVVNV